MCVNYVHYYPKVDLEVCKSAVDKDALAEYFDFLSDYEGQATDPENNSTMNYKVVDWSPMRVGGLKKLYESAPLQMQCQGGSGKPKPGKWNGVPLPEVSLTILYSEFSDEDF